MPLGHSSSNAALCFDEASYGYFELWKKAWFSCRHLPFIKQILCVVHLSSGAD